MNSLNSGKVESIKKGESIITSVRAINKVAGDPAQGKILQIEVAERTGDKSLLAEFLPNDSRIIQSKAQRGWINIETDVFVELFGIKDQQMVQQLNNLVVSTGLPLDQRVQGTHFVPLNIVNPTVNSNQLRLEITETTVQPNENSRPKINPSTNQVVTYNGKPVYRTVNVVNYEPKNVLLASDKITTEAPVPAMQPNPNTQAKFNTATV